MQENIQNTAPLWFKRVELKYPEETKGLISIIIPIYNSEPYLRGALDSVIAQTFENWEAILIDDGSTDKCSEICAEYAEKDSRFKYIRKENGGTLWARKTGLENCRGEFIASLDSDDVFRPQFLEKMFAKINEKSCDFVWCRYEDLKGKINVNKAEYFEFSKDKLENLNNTDRLTVALWNKLIKRSIYAQVLFAPVKISYNDDSNQVFQITYYSEKAAFVPDKLYLLRVDSQTSVSRTFNAVSKEKRLNQIAESEGANYLILKRFFGNEVALQIFISNVQHHVGLQNVGVVLEKLNTIFSSAM